MNTKLKHFLFHVKICSATRKKYVILGFIKINWRTLPQNMHLYENMPIKQNKIVFRDYSGSYSCNPRAIADEIIRQKLPYELVWITNKNFVKFHRAFPDKIKIVMDNSEECKMHYATAKVWVDNERRSDFIKEGLYKRKGQTYIQTFHGSLGIKKTGVDRNDKTDIGVVLAKIDAAQIDYLVSNAKWTTDFLSRMFWNNGKILEIGHPRNDIFFRNNEDIKAKVYKYFGIDKNQKIVLYAPTFREDCDLSCYTLDFEKLKQSLTKKYGSQWVVMMKLHPWIIELKDKLPINIDNIVDATEYPNMQELLVSCDCLITDYSSCVYDYMLQYKPAFIFATDIEKYDTCRGLYYPLSSTPFPVATTNEALAYNIENFDMVKYKKEVKKFLKDKGCIDKGQATKKIVDLIKEIISTSGNK